MKGLAQDHTARKGKRQKQAPPQEVPAPEHALPVRFGAPSRGIDAQFMFSRITHGSETMRTVGLYIWGLRVHPAGAWPPIVGTTPATKVRNLGAREEAWGLVRGLNFDGK